MRCFCCDWFMRVHRWSLEGIVRRDSFSSSRREEVGSIWAAVFLSYFVGVCMLSEPSLSSSFHLDCPFPDRTSLPRRGSAIKSLAGTYCQLASHHRSSFKLQV